MLAKDISSLLLGACNTASQQTCEKTKVIVFYTLILEVICCHFCHNIFDGRESLCPPTFKGRGGLQKEVITRKHESLGGISEVAYYSKNKTKACTPFGSHLDHTSQSIFPEAARTALIRCRREYLTCLW